MDFHQYFMFDASFLPRLLPHHNHTCHLSILLFLGQLLAQLFIYLFISNDLFVQFISIQQFFEFLDHLLSLFAN